MKALTRTVMTAVVIGLLGECQGTASPTTQLSVAYNANSDYVVTLHGAANENVYATAFEVSYVAGQPLPGGYNNPFIGFCVDIAPTLQPLDYWQASTFSSVSPAAEGYQNASSIYRAANIYNAFVGQVNWANQNGGVAGGALQLAIWDVLYGTDLSHVDDSASAFYVSPASIAGYGNASVYQAMVQQANAWLSSSANNPVPLYGATFWQTTDASGNPTSDNQDIIGPQMATGFVPEPGTYFAGSLTGLYVVAMYARGKILGRRAP